MRQAFLALVLLAAPGCQNAGPNAPTHLFAAASLTEAAAAIAKAYETATPGARVQVTTAGSQILRHQIEQGAPADLYLSANQQHAERLHAAGVGGEPRQFARSELVFAVRDESPVRALDDLGKIERLVVGDARVPIGAYAETLLERLAESQGSQRAEQLRSAIASREPNVRLVLAKLELGEADAAVVYRTDLTGRRGLRALELSVEDAVPADYFAVPITAERGRDLARFLTTAAARTALAELGFEPAP